jgi:hypothetical protein
MEDRRTSEVVPTLENLKTMLRERFGVFHFTIEVECENCEVDSAFSCPSPILEPARPGEASHQH